MLKSGFQISIGMEELKPLPESKSNEQCYKESSFIKKSKPCMNFLHFHKAQIKKWERETQRTEDVLKLFPYLEDALTPHPTTKPHFHPSLHPMRRQRNYLIGHALLQI